MRAFLAIELDSETCKKLEDLQHRLRRAGLQDVAWVKPGAMHLTLQFLGEISQEQCRKLQERLRGLPTMDAFSFAACKAGAFPSPARASVLWAGVQRHPQLDELVCRVRECVVACAMNANTQPFSPHLTLGRIRRPLRDNALAQILEQQASGFHAEIHVNSFVLMESRLTPRGPLYTLVERFPLK